MGLFDLLKPKKAPLGDSINRPAVRQAMIGMELEYLQKQVANLAIVGRAEDARKAVTTFLEKYARESRGETTSPAGLARVSYFLAYRVLPDLIHNRWSEFLGLWSSACLFPLYLAIKGAGEQGKRLSIEQINNFKHYQGQLKDDIEYYIVEFPTPPSSWGQLNMDASAAQLAQEKKPSLDAIPVLGPYFLAALSRTSTAERWLYILGQSPGGGTTLRSVKAGGANCNCGPGPEPTAQNFLRILCEHV